LILQLALRLLGGSTAVQEEAAAYFWGRILGAPFVLGNFALIGWFLGQGRAQVVFLVSALGHSVNAVLSVWMVWVMDRGVHGVGFATSVSQLLMFGLLMMVASGVVFSGASGPLDFWPRLWKCLRPSPEWMALFRVNGFAVLRSFFLLLAFSLWMDGAARLGDDFLAMQSILLRVVSLNAYFVDACAMALETMVGQNVRAHVFHLLQLLGQVLLRSFGASLVLLFPWWMWPEWCFSFLTPQQALLDQLVLWRGWLLVVGLLGSLAYGLDGFFVGLTAMKTLAISMILSFALFFLPVYLWALVAHSPVILWSALACLMMGRAVTLLTALRKSRSSGFQGIR
jgi:MATE family multidrug resistance protein